MDADRKRRLVGNLLAIVTTLLMAMLVLAAETPSNSKALALVGGRLLTQTDDGAVAGTILIRDGRIVAVGQAVAIPADATRIDVAGHIITPGLIDARGSLWLNPAAVRESASDGGLDVLDAVDPHDEDWKEVIRQGVTAVYVQPANSGILGGRGAVLRVGPAETVPDIVVKANAAAQAALGTLAAAPGPAAQPTGSRRFGIDPPVTEPTQPATQPTESGNSLARFAQYEQLKRAFEGIKKQPEEKKAGAGKAKRDGAREFLGKVMKGEIPLRLEAHREDDVQNALRLADEFKLHLVLEGVSNPRTATASIVSRRLPLVLGPFVELEGTPVYRKDRPIDWPKALLAQDNRWALGTFSSQPRGSRLLRVHAAAAVARGIPPDRVLRAMTRDAAEILGVGERLGTIATGKQADLVVFAGDPLDPSVPVRLVISSGKPVYQAEGLTVSRSPETRAKGTGLPSRLSKKYALKTQRLLSEDGMFQPGMLLIDAGKIAGRGQSFAVTDDVPTYDLGSAVLTPGLVAGHTQLGLGGAIDDPAEADAGQVRAADVYDPQQPTIRELLQGGFISAVFTPGSANVIGGTGVRVRLGAAEPVQGDAGIKFVLTASSRGTGRASADALDDLVVTFSGRGGRGPARYPGSLAGQVELIEQVLSGKTSGTELYVPRRVSQQILAERRRQIAAMLDRKQVAFFEAHTRAEIDAALQLIGRFKLRGVLVGPVELKPFLEEMRRLGVGIVARPVQVGDYDRPLQELVEAAAAGVPVTFGSGSAQEMRITAALAINAGMSREAAWRGLTSAVGLLVGGPADFVIWDGSPLDLRSRPLRVIVDGKVVNTAR